ncbi:hypothetical protein J6590_083068 [Homalodisca vitripennis]|nr:hypothetical protein J6590_083068 [Homalodisca vitripennis]
MDVCSTCEQLNMKIKSPSLNNAGKRAAVAELLVHKNRSNKFYTSMQHEQSELGKNEKHVLALALHEAVSKKEMFARRGTRTGVDPGGLSREGSRKNKSSVDDEGKKALPGSRHLFYLSA